MKNLKHILSLILISFMLYSCTDKMNMENSGQNGVKENNFANSEEAVQKGKKDLQEILKNKSFDVKIDPSALERAKAETPVNSFEVNFDRLLAADSISIASISGESQKLNTPLVDGNKVVAVITTAKSKKGWELSEITNANLAMDFTEIRNQINNMDVPISIYEVPNINTTIFEVNMDGRKLYFTKTDGRSLQREESEQKMYEKIKVDAQLFQRKFGDLVKKRKLVK